MYLKTELAYIGSVIYISRWLCIGVISFESQLLKNCIQIL